MDNALSINNIFVVVGGKEVLKNFSLTIRPGEIHALMGPNGSGKSSLACAVMGYSEYHVTNGSVSLCGENLLSLAVEERAKRGLFLSFQEPPEVGGIGLGSFLKIIAGQHDETDHDAVRKSLGIDQKFLLRFLNEGFSGGEKKKSEILQFLSRRPRFAIFDEIDSGLDLDSLRTTADIIQNAADGGMGVLLISHSPRLFLQIIPHRVHVLVEGRVAATGGPEIIQSLENSGYGVFSRIGRVAESAPAV
ncbi:MAG TPA: Fe-S cluster assembly ATPase SufC [Patescibacteria group bacterium]|uniref:Fe-S cluster assembly ATPase SufC n=1 Tax=Candidatus Sungbacteria bacterium RIFCSPHIGHO2_02_FULL_47_11 TaxID=1802270 RepID=A0A1G2KGR3_9BACT|nr:MAG: Fe-S cluster assembly ATPase SufC [Candidatus Sungbacteria bacterium RIFCSPHIGHO2_02_FULL_47_11]HLC99973.1 Fe-S cluster assembly ATPase SufC [Patescibacteria group bacterium]